MERIEYTYYGGTGPFGSIPDHQERYGECLIRVVNNLLRPVAPDDPISDGRVYRLVDAFVEHHDTDFELRERMGKTDDKVVLEKAVEVTADEYSYKPETLKNVYRDLYDQYENPTEAFCTDLGDIATHLSEENE